MKIFRRNVGRHDAQSREVAALLLATGGVAALPVVHDAVSWLVWLLGAGMVALGAGIALALIGWVTAAVGPCPVNALLGLERYVFDEKALVDLSLAIVAINGWNRLAVAFRTVPGTYEPELAR